VFHFAHVELIREDLFKELELLVAGLKTGQCAGVGGGQSAFFDSLLNF